MLQLLVGTCVVGVILILIGLVGAAVRIWIFEDDFWLTPYEVTGCLLIGFFASVFLAFLLVVAMFVGATILDPRH
jgi:hypothetical protein